MFSQVFVSGMIANIFGPTEDGLTYFFLKVLKTITSSQGVKSSWAEVIVKQREGYEKYTGKLEIGDLVNCLGKFEVDAKGAPPVSAKDGLPHFILIPRMMKNLGKVSAQTGNDMFFVVALGNLGRDPESRFLDDGTMVTGFSMATTYATTVQGSKVKETTWWKGTAWNKRAEVASQYLKKGQKLLIEADIRFDEETHGPNTFQDKTTKEIRSSFEVTVSNFTMLPTGGSGQHEQGYIPDDEEAAEADQEKKSPAESDEKVEIPF